MCRGMLCRGIIFAALIGALVAAPGIGQAQNLLTNPGLEFTDDTFYHSVPDGWEMTEGPAVPFLPGPYLADYNESGATPANCVLERLLRCSRCGRLHRLARPSRSRRRPRTGIRCQMKQQRLAVVSVADYNQWKLHFAHRTHLSMAEPTNFPHTLLEGNWNMWFQPYNGTFAGVAGSTQ